MAYVSKPKHINPSHTFWVIRRKTDAVPAPGGTGTNDVYTYSAVNTRDQPTSAGAVKFIQDKFATNPEVLLQDGPCSVIGAFQWLALNPDLVESSTGNDIP